MKETPLIELLHKQIDEKSEWTFALRAFKEVMEKYISPASSVRVCEDCGNPEKDWCACAVASQCEPSEEAEAGKLNDMLDKHYKKDKIEKLDENWHYIWAWTEMSEDWKLTGWWHKNWEELVTKINECIDAINLLINNHYRWTTKRD